MWKYIKEKCKNLAKHFVNACKQVYGFLGKGLHAVYNFAKDTGNTVWNFTKTLGQAIFNVCKAPFVFVYGLFRRETRLEQIARPLTQDQAREEAVLQLQAARLRLKQIARSLQPLIQEQTQLRENMLELGRLINGVDGNVAQRVDGNVA